MYLTSGVVYRATTLCLMEKGLSLVVSTCQLTLGLPGERWCSCQISFCCIMLDCGYYSVSCYNYSLEIGTYIIYTH